MILAQPRLNFWSPCPSCPRGRVYRSIAHDWRCMFFLSMLLGTLLRPLEFKAVLQLGCVSMALDAGLILSIFSL